MPGMAAKSSIFEYIKLPEETFTVHFLEWFIPEQGESLSDYAKKMARHVKHEAPVLLGVSFGGILVQEMAKHIKTEKVIIISSIKTRYELPAKMRFARYTKAHKLLPTGLANNIDWLLKYAFADTLTKRLERYRKYIAIRDKYYLDWAIDRMVNWKQETEPENVVHIHGEKDTVFPVSRIKNCIVVKDANHIMIIHKCRWLNKNLPKIIGG